AAVRGAPEGSERRAMRDRACHAHLRRGAPEGAAHGRATGPRLPPESAPIERPPPHRVVTLLPRADLHAGAHAALLEHPPPGVRYHVRWGVHVVERFGAPRHSRGFPWRELSGLEAIDARGARGIVHSARWPVLGRRGWVVDMDDWGYPCRRGRAAWNPDVRVRFRAETDPAFQRMVRAR